MRVGISSGGVVQQITVAWTRPLERSTEFSLNKLAPIFVCLQASIPPVETGRVSSWISVDSCKDEDCCRPALCGAYDCVSKGLNPKTNMATLSCGPTVGHVGCVDQLLVNIFCSVWSDTPEVWINILDRNAADTDCCDALVSVYALTHFEIEILSLALLRLLRFSPLDESK